MLFACKRSYTKTATKNNLVEPWLNAHHGHNQRKFSWGTEVTFGDDYDVIDVQSTMMRLFLLWPAYQQWGRNLFH